MLQSKRWLWLGSLGVTAVGFAAVVWAAMSARHADPASDPGWTVNVAWVSTLACVVWTVHVATLFGKAKGPLFGALVAFALAWALLLPFYAQRTTPPDIIVNAFTGLMLILAGGPLRRAAGGDERVTRVDRWGARLLLSLVLPHIAFLPVPFESPEAMHHIVTALLGCGLMLLGLGSTADGVRQISSDGRWRAILVVAAPYAAAEVAFAVYLITHRGEMMPAEFRLLFAALKLSLTAIFTWLVIRETAKFRAVGWKALLG